MDFEKIQANIETFIADLFAIIEKWFNAIKAVFGSVDNKRGWDDTTYYPGDVDGAGPVVTE